MSREELIGGIVCLNEVLNNIPSKEGCSVILNKIAELKKRLEYLDSLKIRNGYD